MCFNSRVLCLLLGTPNTKYPPITKNYLRCLLLGGVSNRGKGLLICGAFTLVINIHETKERNMYDHVWQDWYERRWKPFKPQENTFHYFFSGSTLPWHHGIGLSLNIPSSQSLQIGNGRRHQKRWLAPETGRLAFSAPVEQLVEWQWQGMRLASYIASFKTWLGKWLLHSEDEPWIGGRGGSKW